MSYAYYNEHDPKAAAWLRELIKQGLIADGEVDERSIEDVTANDLRGFTQCHFFAGIGVWSLALRNAGWDDERPVWTGSCPCQPFSSAGKGKGTDDDRHLWPAFHWLIKQCRPDVIFGEQVAGKAGAAWFDIVSTDLEGEDYTCGKVVFPACGVGAPHQRQRQYWVADTNSKGLERLSRNGDRGNESRWVEEDASGFCSESGEPSSLGNSSGRRKPSRIRKLQSTAGHQGEVGGSGPAIILANDNGNGRREARQDFPEIRSNGSIGDSSSYREQPAGPTNGFWRDADWIYCRDGKWRPAQSGSFPLAHGSPERVGRLRGYGNAIVEAQARAFIEAYQEERRGLA